MYYDDTKAMKNKGLAITTEPPVVDRRAGGEAVRKWIDVERLGSE